MIFLRRVAFVVVAFLLVAFASIALLSPNAVGDFFYDIGEMPGFIRLILVLLIYGVIAGVGYMRFTRPPQHQVKGLVVQSVGSVTALSIESAHDRILKAIKELPGVAAADVSIKAVYGKADIGLNVVIDGDGKTLPERQKTINRTLEQVVKKQLGLKMAQPPTVQISFSDAPQTLPVTTEAAPAASSAGDEAEPLDTPAEENVIGRFLGGLMGRSDRHPDKADVGDAKLPPPLKDHVPVPAATKAFELEGEKTDEDDDDFYTLLQEITPDEGGTKAAGDDKRESDLPELAAEMDDKPEVVVSVQDDITVEESADKADEVAVKSPGTTEPEAGDESPLGGLDEEDDGDDDQKLGIDT